ncbi:MAG: hypothetical protein ACRELY_14545 [Polyangiaceae bacterium]
MRRVLLLVVVMQMLGCSWGTTSPDDFKKEFGIVASTVDPDPNAPAPKCTRDKH